MNMNSSIPYLLWHSAAATARSMRIWV